MPDFPAYFYHESGQSRVVASAAEAKGLGAGWSDQINDAAIQTIRKAAGAVAETIVPVSRTRAESI
jgi:hypothetical protein